MVYACLLAHAVAIGYTGPDCSLRAAKLPHSRKLKQSTSNDCSEEVEVVMKFALALIDYICETKDVSDP